MIWIGIASVTVGAYLFKLAGVSLVGARTIPEPVAERLRLLPIALFAGLIVVMMVGGDQEYVVDARIFGVVAGGVAAWRRAPFLIVLAVAMATTALIRAAA